MLCNVQMILLTRDVQVQFIITSLTHLLCNAHKGQEKPDSNGVWNNS